MRIIKPEEKYLQSYYEGCVETWGHVHDNYIMHNPSDFEDWKKHIFKDYENFAQGKNLPTGFVPSEYFWIISEEEYVGTINIRYELNQKLKEYGGNGGVLIRLSKRNGRYGYYGCRFLLAKLRKSGVTPILLTCEESNTRSKRGIEFFKPFKTENDTILINSHPIAIKRYYFN